MELLLLLLLSIFLFGHVLTHLFVWALLSALLYIGLSPAALIETGLGPGREEASRVLKGALIQIGDGASNGLGEFNSYLEATGSSERF